MFFSLCCSFVCFFFCVRLFWFETSNRSRFMSPEWFKSKWLTTTNKWLTMAISLKFQHFFLLIFYVNIFFLKGQQTKTVIFRITNENLLIITKYGPLLRSPWHELNQPTWQQRRLSTCDTFHLFNSFRRLKSILQNPLISFIVAHLTKAKCLLAWYFFKATSIVREEGRLAHFII